MKTQRVNDSFLRLQRSGVTRLCIGTIGHLAVAILFCLIAVSETRAQQQIDVEITTAEVTRYVPYVLVRIGPYSVTTDQSGHAVLKIAPGTYKASAVSDCSTSRLSTSGNILRNGPASEPDLTFQLPWQSPYRVHFIMRCSGPPALGTIKLKIATTTSCSDTPNEGFSVQEGVTVMIGGKTYTSNAKGVIEIDLPPGQYPVSGVWKDYLFGYVSQNGIKIKPNENGIPVVNLSRDVETLEVRMFTCDVGGREKARAEILEISPVQGLSNVTVTRSRADGGAFVGMQLRDGDLVVIHGHAKIKWLDGNGIINFDGASTIIRIGPDGAPAESKAPPGRSTLEVLKGFGSFFFPPKVQGDEAIWDENGNFLGVRIRTPNARHWIKGTSFVLGFDEAAQTTTVAVREGVVKIEPTYPGMLPFELSAGQRAEISPSGINNSSASTDLITMKKPVFAPNEPIELEFYNPKGFGWDHVVIVQPSKIQLAQGNLSAIDSRFESVIGDGNENDLKERRGSRTFPGLPEGNYEARYISWDSGNNLPIAQVPFRVGNAPPPPPGNPGTTTPPPATNPAKDLSGLWRNPGSTEVYRVRQIGNRLYWGIDATHRDSFANIYYGDIKGNMVDGVWIDLPGSPYVGDGKIFLRIESECKLVKTSEVNHYGAETWVKIGSSCDMIGGRPAPAPAPVSYAKDLSGLWRNPGREELYRLRQIGSRLYWGVDATPIKSFANTYYGDIIGDTVDGIWIDLPGSPYVGDGKIFLRIESECRLVKKAEVNHYAAEIWVKKDSLCDVTGLAQRSNPAKATNPAAKPADSKPGNQTGPVVVDDPSGVFRKPSDTKRTQPSQAKNKPRVEPIPDDPAPSSQTASNTRNKKPQVEPIPEPNDPEEKPTSSKRTDNTNTQQSSGQTSDQTTQPSTGGCSGGAYGIDGPIQARAGEQILVKWSAPADHSTNDWMVIYAAGTSNLVTWGYLDVAGPCGRKGFYLSAGQYDVWLYWQKDSGNTRPVYGPVRLTVTQ